MKGVYNLTCSKCKTENKDTHKYCCQCGLAIKEDVTDELAETLLTEEEIEHLLKFSYVFEINNLVDEAIEAYSAITEVHPDWADIRFKLARAYEAKGKYGKAIAEYKKAIRINDNYVEAHRCLGEIYSDEGFYEEAIEQFNVVLKAKTKFEYADVHNNIGIALEKLGKEDEALEKYQKALSNNKEYGAAIYNLAKYYYKKKNNDRALEHIKKAIEIYPKKEEYKELEAKIKQSQNQ